MSASVLFGETEIVDILDFQKTSMTVAYESVLIIDPESISMHSTLQIGKPIRSIHSRIFLNFIHQSNYCVTEKLEFCKSPDFPFALSYFIPVSGEITFNGSNAKLRLAMEIINSFVSPNLKTNAIYRTSVVHDSNNITSEWDS